MTFLQQHKYNTTNNITLNLILFFILSTFHISKKLTTFTEYACHLFSCFSSRPGVSAFRRIRLSSQQFPETRDQSNCRGSPCVGLRSYWIRKNTTSRVCHTPLHQSREPSDLYDPDQSTIESEVS